MSLKKLSAALLTAAGASLMAPMASAELSASVGIASSYLWRGVDLGSGTPAVSGGLTYSTSGFYTGAWVSSGDTAAGTEYDLYAGYSVSFGTDDFFTIDLSVWNYIYPTGESGGFGEADGEVDFFELSEVVLSLGAGPVALTIYDNIAGSPGYFYYTLSGSFGKFGVTVGMHDLDGGDTPTHINLDYNYNDNLVFTLSQFVADEEAFEAVLDPGVPGLSGNVDDDLKFVVSYSIPIDL